MHFKAIPRRTRGMQGLIAINHRPGPEMPQGFRELETAVIRAEIGQDGEEYLRSLGQAYRFEMKPVGTYKFGYWLPCPAIF